MTVETEVDIGRSGRQPLEMEELFALSVRLGASDLHIAVGVPPVVRVNGSLDRLAGASEVMPADAERLCFGLMNGDQRRKLDEDGEVDFSYSIDKLGRFRCNVFRQRGSIGGAFRMIPPAIRTLEELGLPSVVRSLVIKTRGLVLVTGPTGSGKSTSLAAMIDLANDTRNTHILTLEDPIEYLHRHKQSIIHQREIGADTRSFVNALRAALRQDPDIILLGEMRDLETIGTAISAAETGHLVFATLHTADAVQTVDRIIDVFPPYQQAQIRVQLSMVLEAVISQRLLRTKDGKRRVGAFEVLMVTPAVRSLIREGKTHQLMSTLQTGARYGMQTMDSSLVELVNRGIVAYEDALVHAANPDEFSRSIKNRSSASGFALG